MLTILPVRFLPITKTGRLSYYNAEQGYNANPLKYNIVNEKNNSGKKVSSDSFSFNSNLEWGIWEGLALPVRSP